MYFQITMSTYEDNLLPELHKCTIDPVHSKWEKNR